MNLKFPTKKRVIVAVATVLIVAIAGWRVYSSRANPKDAATVQKGVVSQEIILTGQLKAEKDAKLTFQSGGELAYVGVSEGEGVRKGQLLVRLDTKVLYETYERAVSDLRSAQASLDNVYDQIKGHDKDETLAQKETRTTAEVARDKAYRALEIAKENLANGGIRAPFDGTVASLTYPFTGINTTSAQSQIEVVNLSSIYFAASADQTDVKDLKKGMKVKVILDSFPQDELTGTLSFIGFTPVEGEVGTVYAVKVEFPAGIIDPMKHRIGMGGDAKIVVEEKSDVLFVPSSFINTDGQGKYVTKAGGKKIYINTGLEGEERTEIKNVLKEGDAIYD